MKGHIAAAIAFKYLNSPRRQRLRRHQHIRPLRVPPERNHRRVLQQQQHIADHAGLAQLDQLLLQPKPFAIIHLTELDD